MQSWVNESRLYTILHSKSLLRAIPEKNTWGWKTALFFYPTTHRIQFPRTPTTHVIRNIHTPTTHRIQFSYSPAVKKFPIRSLALVKLRVRDVKWILSFREDETKIKIQLVGLFLRKPDVYIRQLQVHMRISAINSPTPRRLVRGASSGLRGCTRRRSSKIGGRIQKLNTPFLLTQMPFIGSTFAVQI